MHRMSFTKQLDDIDLSRDRAIICGLLLNELIIGSVEHTVHKGIHAEIAVRFIEEDEDVVMFSVADNRSMENAAEWDEHLNQSFERSLITMLTKQLHGTGEERAAEGYEYRIRFSRCDT
jgi:two-component sensor histidine kinase